ncbi:MAG: hypothetical protein RJB62_1819 [Pseudomonadota bacterium]|jgi:hypothetical protein
MTPVFPRSPATLAPSLAVLLLSVSPLQAREEVPFAEFGSIAEAQAALVEAYAAAAAVTPLPATLAAERAYYDSLFATATADELLNIYEGYVQELWRVTNHAGVMPAQASLETLDSVCIGEVLSGCAVSAAGWINGGDEASRTAWQAQGGFTPEDGIRGGIVLLQPDGDTWRVFAWDFQGYRYDAPHLNEDGFLSVRGFNVGSGGGRADLLFARDGDGWAQIELVSWRKQLPDFLPEGLGIWQGPDYDFADMRDGLAATSPLWRETDGNCCGTGGEVRLVFERVGSSLVLSDVEADIAE